MHCWKNIKVSKTGNLKALRDTISGKIDLNWSIGNQMEVEEIEKKKRKAEWNAETNCQHWHRGHSDFAKWWSKREKSHSLAGSVNSWKKLVKAKHVQTHRPNRTRSGSVSKRLFTLHWRIAKWHRKAEPYIPRLAFTKVICVCLHRYQARILTPCWRFVE